MPRLALAALPLALLVPVLAQAAAPPAFTAAVEPDATTGWNIVVLRHQDPRDPARHLQARIAPEAGANLFSITYGGEELLMQPPALADLIQQRAGMPILFPTPNRVRDARMEFEGRTFTFEPNNKGNFIHGLARRRPFRAEAPRATATEASVALVLDWDEQQPEFTRFPIKHRLTVTYTLRANALRIAYDVDNRDGSRLPYGFGLHPYFRLPGPRKDVVLSAPTTVRMEAVEALPTGKLLPATGAHDLRRPRPLDALDLDDVYLGMTPAHSAGFRHAGSGIEVGLRASREFTHLVVFTPWDRPTFCIENQTSSTDAHNLAHRGHRAAAHLLVVPPGARSGGFVDWTLARRAPAATKKDASPTLQSAHRRYDQSEAAQLLPLLTEVLRFPTVAGNDEARRAQQAWLKKTGEALGFVVRDAGLVTEVELPGPPDAPVLGLLVHGDVQPVEKDKWTFPPFEGVAKNGMVYGRGAADDKGPLVQALLAMRALRESQTPLSHTVRLLVGSDEESGSRDLTEYLQSHRPPDYSLVLDAAFPVVVGEKAWDALYLTAPLGARTGGPRLPYEVTALEAGLSPSIVPDEARVTLRWRGDGKGAAEKPGAADWRALVARLRSRPLPPGITLELSPTDEQLEVIARGRSAHAGVNLEGGRNALVALARVMEGVLPASGPADLLAAARVAGADVYGTGLGLTERHPLWGRYAVNVATLKPVEGGHRLVINLRRPPPLKGPELEARLKAWTARFNARTGARLEPSGYFESEPLAFHPRAKIVNRLRAAYARATGSNPPSAISGGGTYAKRMPRSIAFGMWFPGRPYPGHDVDEQVPVLDLHRGAHVLIEAIGDLGGGPPLHEPFLP